MVPTRISLLVLITSFILMLLVFQKITFMFCCLVIRNVSSTILIMCKFMIVTASLCYFFIMALTPCFIIKFLKSSSNKCLIKFSHKIAIYLLIAKQYIKLLLLGRKNIIYTLSIYLLAYKLRLMHPEITFD